MGWLTFGKQPASGVPTPSADKVAIFVDDATGVPGYKGDDGVAHTLKGDPGTGGIPDAPSDGTLYGRKDGAWEDVGSGVSGVSSVNGATGAITLAPGSNVTIVEAPSGTFTVNASGSGGGATLPYKDFVTDYGADPTFTTDCGGAWDAAMADAVTHGGLRLGVPLGARFLVSRGLQNTSAQNAQLPLPSVHYVSDAPITIQIEGYLSAPPTISVITTEPDYAPGPARFESTLTAGSGSMVAAFGPSGSLNNISNIQVVLRDVMFRTVPNPTINGLNLENAACADVDRVNVDTGSINVSGVTTPSVTTSYGFKGPKNGNGANTRIGTIDVVGFYNGYSFGEHTIGINVKAWACIQAFTFLAADHPSSFVRMMSVHCVNGIKAPASGAHLVHIPQYATEHAASGPFTAASDLTDTSNTLYGLLRWRVVLAGTGGVYTFLASGGRNIDYQPIGGIDAVRTITGNDTAVLYDAGRLIKSTASSGAVVTIPQDSAVPWKIGSILTWEQNGTGQLTVAAGSGVTVRVPDTNTSRKQYSVIQAICVATNEWVLVGDYT